MTEDLRAWNKKNKREDEVSFYLRTTRILYKWPIGLKMFYYNVHQFPEPEVALFFCILLVVIFSLVAKLYVHYIQHWTKGASGRCCCCSHTSITFNVQCPCAGVCCMLLLLLRTYSLVLLQYIVMLLPYSFRRLALSKAKICWPLLERSDVSLSIHPLIPCLLPGFE